MATTYVRESSIKEFAMWHMWDALPKLALLS